MKLSLVPPFNANRQLKRTIASSMYIDANDFLTRVRYLRSDQDLISFSYDSKILVDLLMAAESDLKSIIVSLSRKNESPEDAYLVARNAGHNISRLYSVVESRAFRRLKLLSEKDKKMLLLFYSSFRVSNRYKIITLLKLKKEDPVFRQLRLGEISKLLTEKSIQELHGVVFRLHVLANSALKRYTDYPAMIGTNVKKLHHRMEQFEVTLGRRL